MDLFSMINLIFIYMLWWLIAGECWSVCRYVGIAWL